MPLNLPHPIIYLITSGRTKTATTPSSEDFQAVLRLVDAAVAANVDLIQIREKQLSDRTVYDLCKSAQSCVVNSATRLLVNDRADIAAAAGIAGVHLTTRSLRPNQVREVFGQELLIGASTHSLHEVEKAKDEGADFVVFGPVFETESKLGYGPPVGVEQLRLASAINIPVLALGGIRVANIEVCHRAGASGIAAITLLNDADALSDVVRHVRASFLEPK